MKTITVAKGDGIGPEIMDAVLEIFTAAKVPIQYDFIEVGEKVYQEGHLSGISAQSWKTIKENKTLFKAPITTPQGKGYQSLNVAIRKNLSLFANIRPTKALSPYVKTHYPKTNLVIVRENEEDLYAGIEHRQTDQVVQCLKLISKKGCERIVRYAFEYAVTQGFKKVTCMGKDNIMKMTDGLFRKVFDEVALEYPQIETDYMIIDIGAAHLATRPERFEVIVTENLYGDIVSDVVAQVVGSVGMAGSSNVGTDYAMFEAIHGSAPDIAGKGIANPSGLLSAGIMMLSHLGLGSYAKTIEAAWLYTIESGVHTGDIKSEKTTKLVNTKGFTEAVISNLGKMPKELKVNESSDQEIKINLKESVKEEKKLVGFDVFITGNDLTLEQLLFKANRYLKRNQGGAYGTPYLTVASIRNKGLSVWPNGESTGELSDHFCLRMFVTQFGVTPKELIEIRKEKMVEAVEMVNSLGLFEIIKIESLYTFDDKNGFSN